MFSVLKRLRSHSQRRSTAYCESFYLPLPHSKADILILDNQVLPALRNDGLEIARNLCPICYSRHVRELYDAPQRS